MPAGTVHLWLFWLDLPDTGLDAVLDAVLDGTERARAGALTDPTRRGRFVVAHAAARVIVARYLRVAAHDVCWVRTGNGKPSVAGAGLGVNLSHSGALGAIAVTGGHPVGVDVQRAGMAVDPVRLARRYFPPAEADEVAAAPDAAARFATLWARKEACVKATGGRLMEGMPVPVAACGAVRGDLVVRDVPVPDGYRGAVALHGGGTYRIRRRWWTAHLGAGR